MNKYLKSCIHLVLSFQLPLLSDSVKIQESTPKFVIPGEVNFGESKNSEDSFKAFESHIKRMAEDKDYYLIKNDTLYFGIEFGSTNCINNKIEIGESRDTLVVDITQSGCRKSMKNYLIESKVPGWKKEKFVGRVSIYREDGSLKKSGERNITAKMRNK